ncbi:MAG: HAD-IIB family hydrolase [bacterium]
MSEDPLLAHGKPVLFGEVLFDVFTDGTEVLGGAPFNVAWHLQGFDQSPLFISRVGRDRRGEAIAANMRRWGLDTRGLQVDPVRPTGEVHAEVRSGQPTFHINPDQAYDEIASDPELLATDPGPILLYHGTLALRSQTNRWTWRRLLAAPDTAVFVDVNLRAPWWKPEIVQEARDGGRCAVPARTVPDLIDSVGAGDAFCAVTILGLGQGWPTRTVLERVTEFAAAISRRVLNEILLLIDRYDLYGSVAYPKHHRPEDVVELYRLAAASGDVFVNPALTEPFGLTLIEAAASGIPIVATQDGGPRDIIETCRNGVLVDPLDREVMGETILSSIEDRQHWRDCARNGLEQVHRHYSWGSHVRRYLDSVKTVLPANQSGKLPAPTGHSTLLTADRMIISDIDNTLTGSDEASLYALFKVLGENNRQTAFCIATGRDIDGALEALGELDAPVPEILITNVGTEIYYRGQSIQDLSWAKKIDCAWDPAGLRAALDELPGLYIQKPQHQRRFKLSYDFDPEEAPSLRQIKQHLRQRGLRVRPILSFEAYLDLIPIRASSGLAIRFLALKWGFSPDHLLVIGDSGNDEDMLRGGTLGVVVGNYSPELEPLRGRPRIYFARGRNASGVLEGIAHYDFMGRIQVPEDEQA